MSERLDQAQFVRLMQDLAGGSEQAAETILRVCGPVVFRVVRRRLGRRSSRFDSADVAQAVWASFFAHIDRHAQFADSDAMVRFLAAMAANKVRKIQRDNFAIQKRNANIEVPLNDNLSAASEHAKEPTPSQFAMADDLWERLLAETPRSQQQALYLRLDGKSHDEIAKSLGVTTRTVGRIMSRLQRRVSQ